MSGGDEKQFLVSSFHKFVCGIIRNELTEFEEDPRAFIERKRAIGFRFSDSQRKGCESVEEYTDGMRQTVVADLRRLKVTDRVLLTSAAAGDLDTTLVRLTELQSPEVNAVSSVHEIDDAVGGVADDVTDDAADLDEPELYLARNTAYMIPLITAWQRQLGRQVKE